MKIEISGAAIKWFKGEMGLTSGDKIRFYTQIYGSSPVQQGYALGFSKSDPIDIGACTEMEEITFYVENTDLWYFNNHDLHIDYNEAKDELQYKYV